MSIPWRQRLISALNCTPPGTLTRLHFSVQTPGSRPALSLTFSRLLPLLWAGATLASFRLWAVHEVVAEEYRILQSVKYELVTYTPADWVCLFEARFSLRVQHPSEAHLCLASDYVRESTTLPGVHAKSHREFCLVLLVRGLGQLPAVWNSLRVKPRWFGPPLTTRVLMLFPRICLWRLFKTYE